MKIAVINEVSARDKNKFILEALKGVKADVFNVGMSDENLGVELTYVHTGLMAAAALNSGAADFVVGGCGTGQGFLISAMQYPNVYCGLITNPLDAFLFSQINAGNCISLALNKGFGWAADINLKYLFEKLFLEEAGKGYPLHRAESQANSRKIIKSINKAAHKGIKEILGDLDKSVTETALNFPPFAKFIKEHGKL
jgi:ribose 5-phosphate isomerase RpiB